MVVSGEMYSKKMVWFGGAKWLLNVLVAVQYAKKRTKIRARIQKENIIIKKGSCRIAQSN